MVRGTVIWSVWLERNKIIFKGGKIKSAKSLGMYIVNLVKYWCQLGKNNSYLKAQMVIPWDVNDLPVQLDNGIDS